MTRELKKIIQKIETARKDLEELRCKNPNRKPSSELVLFCKRLCNEAMNYNEERFELNTRER